MLKKKSRLIVTIVSLLMILPLMTNCAGSENPLNSSVATDPEIVKEIDKCPAWLDPLLPPDSVILALNEAIKNHPEHANEIREFKMRVLNGDEEYLNKCVNKVQ